LSIHESKALPNALQHIIGSKSLRKSHKQNVVRKTGFAIEIRRLLSNGEVAFGWVNASAVPDDCRVDFPASSAQLPINVSQQSAAKIKSIAAGLRLVQDGEIEGVAGVQMRPAALLRCQLHIWMALQGGCDLRWALFDCE
jgi:hypothetical protein